MLVFRRDKDVRPAPSSLKLFLALYGFPSMGVRSLADVERRSFVWISIAFLIALAASVSALAVSGIDNGVPLALRATGRIAFAYFFLAYVGAPLTTLFGPAFLPVRTRARDFGLAFAAVMLVHLTLIAYLCSIGKEPAIGVFVVFGLAAAFAGILTLLSFARVRTLLPQNLLPPIRTIATTYILYAFLKDFLQFSPSGSFRHLIAYVPFAALAMMSFVLRLAAWAKTSGVGAFATAKLRADALRGRTD